MVKKRAQHVTSFSSVRQTDMAYEACSPDPGILDLRRILTGVH